MPPPQRTLKLTLQDDGTSYVGWQRQARGTSIQGLVEEALARVEGHPVTVHGAGRTDAGVHALGQVASFRLEHALAVEKLQRALNAMLPRDVRVVATAEAAADFHARYAARSKTYRYDLIHAAVASPFDVRYAWHVPAGVVLDADRMRRAVECIVGCHDFAAFRSHGVRPVSTVRTVLSATLADEPLQCGPGGAPLEGRRFRLTLTGDGFLRHMVRAVTGTLLEVGRGKRSPEDFARLLLVRDRARAGPTAPAHGLCLVAVHY